MALDANSVGNMVFGWPATGTAATVVVDGSHTDVSGQDLLYQALKMVMMDVLRDQGQTAVMLVLLLLQ